MKGFILLGALSVLLLAVLVKDAKATSTSSPMTESITSNVTPTVTSATETDKSTTVIISTDISTTTAEKSTTTAEISTTTAEKSTTTAEISTTTAEKSTTTAEKSTTTAEISTTTAEKSTTTAEKSTTTAEKSTTTADKVSAETDISNTATANFTTVSTQSAPDINRTTTIPSEGDTCNSSSCGTAVCVQLYNSFICQCPLKQFYNESSRSCVTGYSVFGEIILEGRNFSESVTSEEYTKVYNEVIDWFQEILAPKYPNYTTTVIESLSVASSRRQLRSTERVKAGVTSMFSGPVSSDDVNSALKNAALSGFGTYESRSICDFACDSQSMSCRASADGQNSDCVCLEGHFKTESHRIDSCNSCSVDCKAGDHRGCVWNDEAKVTNCQCLAGYKAANNGECKACDFGYSGQDCKDNFLLILVIVGSVAGGVIIALLGAVIGISVRSSQKKKDNERTELLPTDRNSGSPSPVVGNLFPKVQVKNDQGHENMASNLYEDGHYSRSIPQRDYDENPWYEMKQPERSY